MVVLPERAQFFRCTRKFNLLMFYKCNGTYWQPSICLNLYKKCKSIDGNQIKTKQKNTMWECETTAEKIRVTCRI